MNINSLLIENGYRSYPNFTEIARWAAAHKDQFNSEAGLLAAVAAQFGESQGRVTMRNKPAPYKLWIHPEEPVDTNAVDQLTTALSLPVAVGGAGMPDLHVGYSLPIGGVVVLDNAISPAFVGYDISCMVMLTVLDTGDEIDPKDLDKEKVRLNFLDWVIASTSFGLGSSTIRADHPVMGHPLWNESKYLKPLKNLAASQLGSSGAGNHFADIVTGAYNNGETFIGLLTHSGSRGVGNKVGHHFSQQADRYAAQKFKFPKGYGWFDLSSEAGQEYKNIMDLMGAYAYANHEIIHERFLMNSGLGRKTMCTNKHNFAWVTPDGLVYHRKGATPAEIGQMGIIPGSSGSASYLVTGKGNPDSWYSASHGAGRPYSRTEAKRRYDPQAFRKHMDAHGITYHGVAPDETIAAYKNIHKVIEAQSDLVEVTAVMFPKVVVMGGHIKSDDGD